MKLRQKLAVALASAMVLTSVPVVTMAASTNTITRPNVIVKENESYTSAAEAPAIKINFDSFEEGEEFYLTLTNATWTDEMFALAPEEVDASIVITKESNKVAKVVINELTTRDEVTVSNTTVKIPLLVKLTGGEASVALTTEGSNASITEGTYTFATTSDKVATVTAGTPASFSKEGRLGTITIAETFAGSMAVPLADRGTDYRFALVELNDTDYKFDLTEGLVDGFTPDGKAYKLVQSKDKISLVEVASGETVKTAYTKYEIKANFTYGFTGKGTSVNVFLSEDGDSMYVELPNGIDASSKGRIELNNLYVKAAVKNPAEGNITVDVTGNVEAAKDLVVAVNGDYNAAITIANDEKVEILAGETEQVNFTIKETVDNTFTNGRTFEVKADNGYFMVAEYTNKKVDESKTLTAFQKAFASITQQAGGSTVKYTADNIAKAITSIEIEDGKVVGFTFKPQAAYVAQELDMITFELNMSASIEDKGEVKLTVDSRDLKEEISGVIANIRAAVEITSEVAVLKTGLQNQEGGKITIKETEAGVLNRSEQLYVYLPEVSGIAFSTSKDKLPEVNVLSGDIQVSDVKIVTVEKDGKDVQALQVTIKRDSKTASTIEIANFHIDTDRTVAEGKYNAELGGKALTSHAETVKLADFITIATANTEDLVGANGLAKGKSVFVIGESKYTLNGVEKTMDAKSYIQDPGYTMIPVRYVAEAFGVQGNDILFSKGVVTLFAGNRTIQLTVGSDVAVVNGAQIKLSTKVAVVDGRTYAPVGEIARILGVSSQWDNTTKTATFINK